MIELVELTKYYGKIRGIEKVNLKVGEGEVFGFLGPNGAGKTTTIRLMLDLIRPTSGSAYIMGHDCNKEPHKVKEFVEYLPGDFVAYDNLTCEEYINFIAGFYDYPKTSKRGYELIKYFELDASRPVRNCSKGMKQKLGLIQAFMVDCPLYILDEPTSALDPLIQQKFYSLVDEEKGKGKTVFLSSHILSEVERMCDRVGIIRDGKLVAVDSVSNLTTKKFKKVKITYEEDLPDSFFEKPGIEIVNKDGPNVTLNIVSSLGKNLHHLTNHPIKDMHVHEPSLEDIFLSYYGGGSDK